MLVSSIARFNALNTMNNAAFASMQTSNSMINAGNNSHTFGGEHDLSMLNKMDKSLSLDLAANKLLYKMASLQEKLSTKHQDSKLNKSLNYLA